MSELTLSATSPDTDRVARAARQAAKVRRWGWWYQAEWRLFSMKAYLSSIFGWAVLVPLLYVLAMGVGLGALVDGRSGGIDGVPYLTFVAPGLLVSTAVMSFSNEMMFPVMSGFKWQELYFARAATSGSAGQVAIAELVAVTIRSLGESAIFWVVLISLGATSGGLSALMIPIGALSGLALGAPIAAYSATLANEGFQFSMIQRFVLNPMFLFAGTFYPLATMPVYLQWIGWISPMWHGTQLARALSFGLPLSGADIAFHLGFLIVAAATGCALTIRNFRRRLTK